MSRIAAGTIVTFMKYAHIFWNRCNKVMIGKSMSVPVFTVSSQPSVAVTILIRSPFPTATPCFTNVPHKSLDRCVTFIQCLSAARARTETTAIRSAFDTCLKYLLAVLAVAWYGSMSHCRNYPFCLVRAADVLKHVCGSFAFYTNAKRPRRI